MNHFRNCYSPVKSVREEPDAVIVLTLAMAAAVVVLGLVLLGGA